MQLNGATYTVEGLLTALLDGRRLSGEEAERLRSMIDEARGGRP